MSIFTLLLCTLLIHVAGYTQSDEQLTGEEIIRRADQKIRGESSQADITMTVERPTWKRQMSMRSWTKGTELALILITAPERDNGIAYLKRDKELWNWQPTIDRVIKLPPSMMMQSWMGSDFTNDDLVKESSMVDDYEQNLVGDSTVMGYECYKLELIPKENAPVVWGKIEVWISKEEYLQLLTKFYDEDGYLINIMYGSDIKELGGKILPSRMEMIPVDKEGHKTILQYNALKFNVDIDEDFFSIQNMKRVR